MDLVKAYRPETNSFSNGQVLQEAYTFRKARVVVQEMAENMTLELVSKRLVTDQLVLTIGYDKESLVGERGKDYHGEVVTDHYGRAIPRHAHGTGNLEGYTSSSRKLVGAIMEIYQRVVDPKLLIRRVNIAACGLLREKDIPEEGPEQLDLFTDYAAREAERAREMQEAADERSIQETVLRLQDRFGKNAVLKGMNLMEGATTIMRNGQVGGHRA